MWVFSGAKYHITLPLWAYGIPGRRLSGQDLGPHPRGDTDDVDERGRRERWGTARCGRGVSGGGVGCPAWRVITHPPSRNSGLCLSPAAITEHTHTAKTKKQNKTKIVLIVHKQQTGEGCLPCSQSRLPLIGTSPQCTLGLPSVLPHFLPVNHITLYGQGV